MNGLSDRQIFGGAVLFGDDHHVAATHVDVDVGNADAVDQQRAFAADELNCVAGERFQMGGQPALGLPHQVGDVVVGALGAADQPTVAGVHAAFVQANLRAVLDLLEDVGSGLVDQGDSVVDQYLRAEVGVAARDGRRGVDDGGDVSFHQRVGGNAVQVQDVEDHDVARTHPAEQSIDIAVDSSGAGQAGSDGVARQQR